MVEFTSPGVDLLLCLAIFCLLSSTMSAIINALLKPEEGSKSDLRLLRTLAEYRSPIQKLVFVVLFYILVSVYYNNVEGWDVEDCIYFITVTITTVGYGDFHPTTDVSSTSFSLNVFTFLCSLLVCSLSL